MNKIKHRILRIVMFLIGILFSVYRLIFPRGEIVNNRLIIESYYKEDLMIEINPNDISHYLPVKENINGSYQNRCEGFYCGGDWYSSIKLIEEHRKTKDMFELFKAYENENPYTTTKAYDRHIYELTHNKLNTENEPAGEVLHSDIKIKKYYKENIKLFENIKRNGFKEQRKVGSYWRQEIGIAIGQEGELFRFGNGYHRMAIAKYLQLTKVPAVIKLVHKDWHDHCHKKYENDPLEAVKEGTGLK